MPSAAHEFILALSRTGHQPRGGSQIWVGFHAWLPSFLTLYASQTGADVIKVEHPKGGDPGRGLIFTPDGFDVFFEASDKTEAIVF